MSFHHFTTFMVIFLHLTPIFHATSRNKNSHQIEPIRAALEGIAKAIQWARAFDNQDSSRRQTDNSNSPFADCVELYEDSRIRIASLSTAFSDRDDAVTWLSAAMASHRTCLDGLEDQKFGFMVRKTVLGMSLMELLEKALAFSRSTAIHWRGGSKKTTTLNRDKGMLMTWNAAASKADFVVAQDGSGNSTTINEAVAALAIMCRNRSRTTNARIVVHVKSGIYNEKVVINRNMTNVMFVGDGMDFTIITGSRNFMDGASTLNSATFGVLGDGFWARDMTFENTAGPEKYQAVALSVHADLVVFYRCSFIGYQDTLFAHSLRQFYRDCNIYGTIDFIFGDASAVFQNCDILLRKPLDEQANVITAQGRDNLMENTGFSIINSRVVPTPELISVQGQIKSYLGRPWKQYSRTVFMKTNIDGAIDPEGWTEWNGTFALSTLYFGEYRNAGKGASTSGRVKWPGFHVITDAKVARSFDVKNFIKGDSWIPATGVPFWPGI